MTRSAVPRQPELMIRLKKHPDGSASLSCLRGDGTVTWQRQTGTQGRFFPVHDLTHFAVETVLQHRRGFYGLVAEGWDFADFGMPWPRGPLPADLDPSELLVGFFDAERAAGVEWSAEDFNREAASYFAARGSSARLSLGVSELGRIRRTLRELVARWQALPCGETLELEFERRRFAG